MSEIMCIPRLHFSNNEWDEMNRASGGTALSSFYWLNLAGSMGMRDLSFGLVKNNLLIGIVPIWVISSGLYRRGTSMLFGFGNLAMFNTTYMDSIDHYLREHLDILKVNSSYMLNVSSFKLIEKGSEIVVQVLENSEDYLATLDSRTQKYIRSAQNDISLEVRPAKSVSEVEICWGIYLESMRNARSKGSITDTFFTEIFHAQVSSVIMLGIQDEKVTSFLILVGSNGTATAVAAGVSRGKQKNSLTPLLMKKTIDWARENNFQFIHFWGGLDGSEDGIFFFKRKYGQIASYYQYLKIYSKLGKVASTLERALRSNQKRRIHWLISKLI